MKNESKQVEIIKDLISKHKSMREFARVINEDSSAVLGWRNGRIKIHCRAVATLAKLFKIKPHDLRPDLYEEGTELIFTKKEKK